MHDEKTYRNPLIREGKAQNQRALPALEENYVRVDERSQDDLITFAAEFSRLIQFYEESGPSGTWEPLFEKKSSVDAPHVALYRAFIKLFKYLQADINTLSRKHLDYYYKEVLKLQTKAANPDSVHLLFELAKNIDAQLIKKGTLLKAGKDVTDKELFYAVDEDVVLNKSTISSLKNVFIEKITQSDGFLTDQFNYGIYASPIANSSDGHGADMDDSNLTWETLGTSQITSTKDQKLMSKAEIGFALSSPVLNLKEGQRIIELRLTTTIGENLTLALIPFFFGHVLKVDINTPQDRLNQTDINSLQSIFKRDLSLAGLTDDEKSLLKKAIRIVNTYWTSQVQGITGDFTGQEKAYLDEVFKLARKNVLTDAFVLQFSGEEAWLGDIVASGEITSDRQFSINVELSKDFPAVVGFQTMIGGSFLTDNPIVKVTLNRGTDAQGNDYFAYHLLKNIRIINANIEVEVNGIKNLLLQSERAMLNPSKPFEPFGPIPAKKANFYVGSAEAFQKKLRSFTLTIDWKELPSNFESYYQRYNQVLTANGLAAIDSQTFTATLQYLQDYEWQDVEPVNYITDGEDPPPYHFPLFPSSENQSTVQITSRLNNQRSAAFEAINQFDINTQTGFLKLQLSTDNIGEFEAFGHSWYPKLLTESIIEKLDTEETDNTTTTNANNDIPADVVQEQNDIQLPNQPYTPAIQGISLDYKSKVSFKDQMSTQEQFFHLAPFGEAELSIAQLHHKNGMHLLPQFSGEGFIFIGVQDAKPPQNLSVLFQLDEKSVNHEYVGKVEVAWEYLANNVWKPFEDKNGVFDGTELLTKSGIVKFQLPKDITDDNSILPAGLHWIRAFTNFNTQGIAKARSIRTQAIKATFVDQGNSPSHLAAPIPGKKISKLQKNNSAIKSIEQPYPSFDGQLPEKQAVFNTRVSERLRHKNRAVSIWDYESIILEKFPTIYKVKCLNHTHFSVGKDQCCSTEMVPGAVTLTLLADVRNETVLENKLRPTVNVITIQKIRDHLKQIISPFIWLKQNLEIRNPDYETVKIRCSVKFRTGFVKGYYLKELDTDIKKFLSPWAFDKVHNISFERKIYQSVLINYIEELDYIDFICCFKMFHSANKDEALDVIEASNAATILISADNHTIKYISGEKCDCSEGDDHIEPLPVKGIGVMIIEDDFKIL